MPEVYPGPAVSSADRSGSPLLASMIFTTTPTDVTAAYRAYLRWADTRPRGFLSTAVVGLLSSVAVLVFNGAMTAWVFLPAVGVVLARVILRLLTYACVPRLARRTVGQQKNLQQEMRVELSESGLRAITATQDSYVAWVDYMAWSQDRHVIMLYQSDRLFQFIPMRAVTASAQEVFDRKMVGVPCR